jgi:ABC-type antimicrobial peptide transport system permease subunit
MALGAHRRNVLGLVLGHGAVLVGLGVAAGLVAALALTSAIPAALLPNVSARDPLTFGLTTSLLVIVALAATWIPAYRATRIDPLVALRAQ